jgi:signal transduction histidine kinase
MITRWNMTRKANLALAALQNSEARYRNLIETSPAAILTLNHEGKVLFASATPFGSKAEITGTSLLDSVKLAQRPAVLHTLSNVGPDQTPLHVDFTGELAIEDRPARLSCHLGRTSRLNGDDSITAVVTNVTEEYELRQTTQRAEKLTAIATFAAGAAHELNNVLGAAAAYSELILLDADPKTKFAEHAGQILKATSSGEALIRKILTFSRTNALEPEALFPDLIVEESIASIRSQISRNVRFKVALSSPEAQLKIDLITLQQAVSNLLLNALHALKASGGELHLHTELKVGDDDSAFWVLEIRDTGCGMEPEVLERAFDAFVR